jgi:hypothetical protein
MPKFRLHTTDGTKTDVDGKTAEAVRKTFEKENPEIRVTKIKLVRE